MKVYRRVQLAAWWRKRSRARIPDATSIGGPTTACYPLVAGIRTTCRSHDRRLTVSRRRICCGMRAGVDEERSDRCGEASCPPWLGVRRPRDLQSCATFAHDFGQAGDLGFENALSG